MGDFTSDDSVLELPENSDLTVYLIREELKSHHFFTTLHTLGLDDTYYQTELSPIILAQTGLGEDTPETMAFYTSLLEKYSPRMVPGGLADLHTARNMYLDLLAEQKRRSACP